MSREVCVEPGDGILWPPGLPGGVYCANTIRQVT